MRFFEISARSRFFLKVFGVSALGMLLVLAGVGYAVWHYRVRLQAYITPQAPLPQVVTIVEAPKDPVPAPVVIEAPKDLTVSEVVSKVNKSVVSIDIAVPRNVLNLTTGEITTTYQHAGGGSGFFVSSDGMVLTNKHVVSNLSAQFTVVTADGKKYPATLVGRSPDLDIAVLKIQGKGFRAVTLGDSKALSLGQSVVAIGFALGQFNNSISVGVISGLSRSIDATDAYGNVEHLDQVIQTDAAINPGNSGGPLLNLKGEVVGVSVATAQGSQSVGFALPINSVKSVIAAAKRGTLPL